MKKTTIITRNLREMSFLYINEDNGFKNIENSFKIGLKFR